MSKKFGLSLDQMSTILTIIVFGILAIVTLPFLILPNTPTSTILLLLLFNLVVLLLPYLLSPAGYEVSNQGITVFKKISQVTFQWQEIKEIKKINLDDLGYLVRTFGSGGYFGYFGKFYSKKLGHLTLYTSRRDQLIYIELNNQKKILLSPDEADEFMKFVNQVKPNK